MIRKPIGNWQFAIGKIYVTPENQRALPIAYCQMPIEIKNPLRNERVHHYEQSWINQL